MPKNPGQMSTFGFTAFYYEFGGADTSRLGEGVGQSLLPPEKTGGNQSAPATG